MARSAAGSLRDRRTGRWPLSRLASTRAKTLGALAYRIAIHDSALKFLRDAYQECAETQWLYRGPDGVASLNTIDIGFGSNQAGIVDLAGRTIRRVEGRLLADGKDPKLVGKHLWMRAYCQDLLRANEAALG